MNETPMFPALRGNISCGKLPKGSTPLRCFVIVFGGLFHPQHRRKMEERSEERAQEEDPSRVNHH